MFQQFDPSIRSTLLCRLAVPHLISNFHGCFLLSQYHYINLIFTHTHTHGPLSGTTRVSRYQKGKTNLDFTEARNSEWQWHQLGHMLVCTSLQTDNHASTALLSLLQAGCPSCRPTNSPEGKKISNIHWIPISPVACIISANSPDNPGALCFFIFFTTAEDKVRKVEERKYDRDKDGV